ncbi:MAG TPA: hypothetical protein VIR54_11620 [Vicinamibacterales bacterium]
MSFTNADNARTYTLDTEALHRSSTHAYETQLTFISLARQRGRLEIDGNVRHDIFGNM